jgi:dTMP kinase
MYIVLEWMVGTGKTTQTKLLFDALKREYPAREVLMVREPGSTEIAQAIRQVVQWTKFDEVMHPLTEAYLYAASRAQLLHTVVRPALDRGAIVISDRSVLSSLAYQGGAQGVSIEDILSLNELALRGSEADIIFGLSVDIDTALSRTFDTAGDKFESYGREFFERVVSAYEKVSQMPIFASNWQNIDASWDIDSIHKIMFGLVQTKIES